MRFVLLLWTAWLIQQPEVRVTDLEKRLYEGTNSERTGAGIPRLSLDKELAGIARTHSQNMAARGFFSHVDPQGRNSRLRVRAAGYACTGRLGENLASNYLYSRVTTRGNSKSYDWYSVEDIAANTARLWMKSAGHRANILDRRYDRTGIGVAMDNKGKVYTTQLFCGLPS